jgi:hypothetical protein
LGKAFGDSNRLQLEVVQYPEWYNSAKGNRIIDIIANGLENNERLKRDRIDKIVEIVKQRKEVFEKFIKNKI